MRIYGKKTLVLTAGMLLTMTAHANPVLCPSLIYSASPLVSHEDTSDWTTDKGSIVDTMSYEFYNAVIEKMGQPNSKVKCTYSLATSVPLMPVVTISLTDVGVISPTTAANYVPPKNVCSQLRTDCGFTTTPHFLTWLKLPG